MSLASGSVLSFCFCEEFCLCGEVEKGAGGGRSWRLNPLTHPPANPLISPSVRPPSPLSPPHPYPSRLLGVVSRVDHVLLEPVEPRLEELHPRDLPREGGGVR